MELVGPGTGLVTGEIPALVAGLCDDAAVFPPGLAPLPDAVRAHAGYRTSWYAALVGPFVVSDAGLGELAALVPAGARVPVSVTLPGGPDGLPAARDAAAHPALDLRAVEVAVPAGADVAAVVAAAAEAAAGDLDAYVEVPRDERGPAVLAEVARRGLRAKFRTGGVRADLHPGEAELAASLAAAVRAGVAFKATAGLHHAVRTTDPRTGFEQHGFLNVLLATDALAGGGTEHDARALLAERDGATVATLLRGLDAARVRRARAAFTSFGTCSIAEPLADLVELGLVDVPDTAPVAEGVPS